MAHPMKEYVAKLIIYAQVPVLVVVPLSNRVGHKKQLKNSFQVSHSGGRPCNTSEEAGYGVGVGSGRPRGNKRQVEFDDSIQLPPDWDHSGNMVNVDDELLDVCAHRIAQQRTFDKKPLGLAVCYGCGHLLWSCVDGAHTFFVNKPSGMSAPASAYL